MYQELARRAARASPQFPQRPVRGQRGAAADAEVGDSRAFCRARRRRARRTTSTHVDGATKFIPGWVKVAVAIALGLGTMIGWKRIVVTVGEKIGKDHLTYAQGAAAEITAMVTIGAADAFGLPVSTTHVLSSGVAGTMAANRSGLQWGTVRNLLMAWVLTLPVSICSLGRCCSGCSGS